MLDSLNIYKLRISDIPYVFIGIFRSSVNSLSATSDSNTSWSFWSRASEVPRDYDGACLQMRLSYSPVAHLFLFLVQWTDCSLAGALGLLRILIYKVMPLYWSSVLVLLVERKRYGNVLLTSLACK
jgi:hypothetical protein